MINKLYIAIVLGMYESSMRHVTGILSSKQRNEAQIRRMYKKHDDVFLALTDSEHNLA